MEIVQWSLPQRRDHIKQLRASGTALYQHSLTFQGTSQNFPVYSVEIGFPCYRLANGRTKAAQIERIAESRDKKEKLPEDFFTADPDSQPALEMQDQILRQMIAEAGLLRAFKKVKQEQPLILDNDGYVVNGNRRLCAMRLLLVQDPAAYEHFKHVQVIVLPPCTDRDIKELEGRLQVQPDIRADYSWAAEAMLYRDLRTQGWTDEQVADLYQKKIVEIRELVSMLDDAEQYLDTRTSRGKYSHVVKKEYAFRQLQKARKNCEEDEARKQVLTSVAYLMLDDPDTTEKRLYESIPDAFKFLDKVVENVQRELPQKTDSESKGDDGLEILGGSSGDKFAGVVAVLNDPANASKGRDVIRDTLKELRAQERERKDATYCYRQIQQAYTRLQSALSSLDPTADRTGIEDALNNVEQTISDIRDWMSNGNDQN